MRRRIWSVVVVGALTACTPASGVDVLDAGVTSDTSSDATADATGVDGGTADAESSGAAGGPVSIAAGSGAVPLPGLLDDTDEPLPADPTVRTGTLDNGLTYSVRANDNPGGKAELRLAVRSGSVDEFGPSTGVAHFVEHMLFNGTEQFPENELIDTLRSFGAAFGADVNAYTAFDETVYQLTVPNDGETVELGLTVLEQWLSHATFDPDQVVAERGVVLDEWRVRTQSTGGRLYDVAEGLYLAGTPYAGRSPIGTDEAISAMGADELRAFYDRWYRPDNAAIVAVGDFDVDAVAGDIERLFGPAAARGAAEPAAPDPVFVTDTSPNFALHADPDQTTVDVEVTLPLPSVEGTGTRALRADLIDRMIFDVLVRRLDTDVAAGTAPFDQIVPGTNSFVDGLDAPALYAFTDAARVDDTLVGLLTEYERAVRYGFSAAETDLARDAVLAPYDSVFEGRESAQDRFYADRYADAFLTGGPLVSIADEHAVVTEIATAVTPEALAERFRARWANSAPHVIISTPDALADQMPTADEVLATIASVAAGDVEPRGATRDLPDVLMERPPTVAPASVEHLIADANPLFDPIEFEFPNGVRMILVDNDIVEGQIYLMAASRGGSSLVADADVPDALHAADVVTSGGVADFNQAELAEILAGQDVDVSAYIEPYEEGFYGSAASADVESALQLVHLYMTQPRFDPVALHQLQQSFGPTIDDPGSEPTLAAFDLIADTRYGGELRYTQLLDRAAFDTVELDGISRVWNDRFGDATDWVFVLAGDLDVDTMETLGGAYLATLPASGTREEPVDVEDPPPAGVVAQTIQAGTGDTASVNMLFTVPLDDVDGRVRAQLDVASEVMSARLTDVVREQYGDTYSPSVFASITTDPDPVVETIVRVTGSPDRVDAIAELVVAELADLGANGPSDREFSNAYAQVEEAYSFVNNGQFLQELLDDAIDPALELDDFLAEQFSLGSVSAGSTRDFVRTYVPTGQYVEVTVVPR